MAKKKVVGSSQPGKLVRRSEADIRRYIKSAKCKEDSARLEAHTRKYGGEPSPADLKEMPEMTDEELRLFRPIKAPVTVRIDGDILAWLKAKGGPYQTHMNATLRSAMLAERKRSSR